MPKHPKRPRDPNQLAKSIIAIATGEMQTLQIKESANSTKARKAGLKGGIARSEVLTPQRRKEIATAAAIKRWGNEGDGE